jgi:hypothetical protein
VVLGVRLRRPKARTPLCVKEAKKRSEGVIVKIEDLFVIKDLIGGNNIKTHLIL